MPNPGKIPEAAVEAAARAFEGIPNGTQFRERLARLPEYGENVMPPSRVARVLLQAAAPAIYADLRERVIPKLERREELAAGNGQLGLALGLQQAQEVVNAAFDTATKGESDA